MHSLPAEVPTQTLCRLKLKGKTFSQPLSPVFSSFPTFSPAPSGNSLAPFNRQVRAKAIKMYNNCNGEH